MRYFILFLIIAFPGVILAQGNKPLDKIKSGLSISDLKYLDSSQTSIIGKFNTGDGFGGYSISLDSFGVFTRTDFSCLDISQTDSGSYRFKTQKQVELISEKNRVSFDVIQFDTFLFFVPTNKMEVFKKDFLSLCETFNQKKGRRGEKEPFTVQSSISFNLSRKYLTKGEF